MRGGIGGACDNVPDYMVDGTSGDVYRLITDQLGSVVMVVRADNGTVVQEIEYDAWGRSNITCGSPMVASSSSSTTTTGT